MNLEELVNLISKLLESHGYYLRLQIEKGPNVYGIGITDVDDITTIESYAETLPEALAQFQTNLQSYLQQDEAILFN